MKRMKNRLLFMVLSFLIICGTSTVFGGDSVKSEGSSAASVRDFVKADKKIYFGHQSVGLNMLDGLEQVLNGRNNGTMTIEKIDKDSNVSGPALYHSFIGYNEKTDSKLEDFHYYVESVFGGNLDVALMKFCYLDIEAYTDVDSLYDNYKATIDTLESRFPDIRFVHMTVPLRGLQKGPKAWVKRVLGKPVVGYEDNRKRERFNAMVRRDYGENLFDIALLESTRQSGERALVEVGGQQVPYLASEYTDDGGHLNDVSKKLIAEEFLKFLDPYLND